MNIYLLSNYKPLCYVLLLLSNNNCMYSYSVITRSKTCCNREIWWHEVWVFKNIYIKDCLYKKKVYLSFLWKKQEKNEGGRTGLFFYRKVLIVIRLTQSRKVRHDVIKEMTIAGLSNMFEKPSINNKEHLLKTFFNQKMIKKNTFFTQHLNELNIIVNQLSFIEIKFNDEIQTLILSLMMRSKHWFYFLHSHIIRRPWEWL